MAKVKRALISVFDKNGLVPFAEGLHRLKVEIISTGGTLKALQEAGIPARSVLELTGFPEILDGRVKTLHPKILGGLLYRRGNPEHEKAVSELGIPSIDLVVVNLYPFAEIVGATLCGRPVQNLNKGGHGGPPLQTALEYIDIGGPAMLRSAAKNYESVAVVTDPADYSAVLEELKNKEEISLEVKARLAQKVFEKTSGYDRLIADYLKQNAGASTGGRPDPDSKEVSDGHAGPSLPPRLDVVYEKALDLRYGENPHQRAALYRRHGTPRFDFKILHGKELSFNNLLDFEATIDILREFKQVAACVVKHTNPSGIAEGKTLEEAVSKAVDSDPMSAFGGIVGFNRPCDLAAAKKLYELLRFIEVAVAPRFLPDALEFLKERKNIRLIEVGEIEEGGPWDLRFTKFGVLLQDRNRPVYLHEDELRKRLKVATKKQLEAAELEELLFGWRSAKTVRSNAIVLTKNHQTVGIGAGQMSRVDSVMIACQKAGVKTKGSFLASDAFFPMPDSIEKAAEAGVRAVIQPGGSIKDNEVIAACDRAGIAMVLTGERHFRH